MLIDVLVPVRKRFLSTALLAVVFSSLAISSLGAAQTIINSGFNDMSGWTTSNDAVLAHPGGVDPWEWNTPVVERNIVTAMETVLPVEGSGMGLTYAGADTFTQEVLFDTGGEYLFEVDANAIMGTVLMPAGVSNLVDGEFAFRLDSATSPVQIVDDALGWTTFSWTVDVSEGLHQIGLRNTLSDKYVIAYDDFRITAIPGPGTVIVLSGWLAGFGLKRSRRREAQA